MKLRYNFLLFILSIVFITEVYAKPKKAYKVSQNKKQQAVALPPQTSVVVDMQDGKILHAENAHLRVYPASLTKVMTLYLTFEAIDKGVLSMDQRLTVSKRAANMRPSKLGLKVGETISVKDAVMSLIVKSANDSSVVLGEAISGASEDHFAQIMTKRAKDLGMHNTTFRNASGWHHPEQKTTAIDMAKLTMALKRDFPDYYSLFSATSFTFNGKTVTGHNKVVEKYQWAEGLKTGYTNPAGHNLITTAAKDGKRLVGVVTGGRSANDRNYKMVSLLDRHFGLSPSGDFLSDNATFASNKSKPVKSVSRKSKSSKIQVVKAKGKKKARRPALVAA